MIVLQRHPQGPRLYVLGQRIHECTLGLCFLAILLAAWLASLMHPSPLFVAVGAPAMWLLIKDWRDLFPSKRDSASWSFGIHRRLGAPSAFVELQRLPAAPSAAVAAGGPTKTEDRR